MQVRRAVGVFLARGDGNSRWGLCRPFHYDSADCGLPSPDRATDPAGASPPEHGCHRSGRLELQRPSGRRRPIRNRRAGQFSRAPEARPFGTWATPGDSRPISKPQRESERHRIRDRDARRRRPRQEPDANAGPHADANSRTHPHADPDANPDSGSPPERGRPQRSRRDRAALLRRRCVRRRGLPGRQAGLGRWPDSGADRHGPYGLRIENGPVSLGQPSERRRQPAVRLPRADKRGRPRRTAGRDRS